MDLAAFESIADTPSVGVFKGGGAQVVDVIHRQRPFQKRTHAMWVGSTAAYRLTMAVVVTYVRSALPKSVTDAMTAKAAAIMAKLDLLCMAGKRGHAGAVPGTH